MPPLKFTEVLTYSSEDPNHPVDNLLKPDSYLKWKSKAGQNEKQEYAVLKIEKLTSICSLDIGNEHSAFVEVLVSREGTDFQVLLVASSFMSPLESRNSTTTNRVRMFGSDKLNKSISEQKWDRIKIICTQPFNKSVQYGLTFIKIYGPENKQNANPENDLKLGKYTIRKEEEHEPTSIGLFFAKRNEKDESLTGAAGIRAASKAITLNSEKNQAVKRQAGNNSVNAPELGFYQLQKKVKVTKEETTKVDGTKKSSENASHFKGEKTEKSESNVSSKMEDQSQKTKHRPFNKLMSDVVFVFSGYQNPKRSQLRDSLIAMGAKYKADWEHGCTHLICAFKNTPKFNSVRGKGKIVSAKWIEDSFNKKIRLPWRRYNLEKSTSDESEEEVWATEISPNQVQEHNSDNNKEKYSDTEEMADSEDTDDEIQKVLRDNNTNLTSSEISKEVNTKQPGRNGAFSDDEYDADTDVDEDIKKADTSDLPLPPLKNIFSGKNFFLYGSLNEIERELKRYIIAFQGNILNYMSETVNYVITNDAWDENFDNALNENPSLHFVKPQWIWKCCNSEKAIPPQPFLVVPKNLES